MPVSPGMPGKRRVGDDLSPRFRLEINDKPLNYDINRLVQSIEFESALDMADMLKVVIDNPGLIDDEFPDWTGHKAFQPGNEVSLYMGYGELDKPDNFIGRVVWNKHLPQYPSDGIPQLEVKGYDLSNKMMSNEGPVVSAGKNTSPATKRPVDFADDQGQVFQSILHSEVVERIATMYNMVTDIDATTKRDHLIIKKGKKHFELVKGLANLNNRDFWVDYSVSKARWVLHWKTRNRNQGPQYILRYGMNNSGDPNPEYTGGTLLKCEPEYGLTEAISTATILIFDGKTQQWVSAIEIEDASGPDPIFKPGGGVASRAAQTARPSPRGNKGTVIDGKLQQSKPRKEARSHALKRQAHDVIHDALDNAAAFRIAAGGVALDVIPPGVRFKTPEDAAQYLLRWFQQRQDNFITIKATTVGIETLKARQVHTIRGLGERLDGDYFLTRVAHSQASDNYTCEITANKVIKG